jgi:hypothetical protein
MKRIISKITRVIVTAAALCSAGVTIVNSQTQPTARNRPTQTPVEIKVIDSNSKRNDAVEKAYADGLKADAPQYQELRCRGGGLNFYTVDGRTNSSGEQTVYMLVNFKAAVQSASYGSSIQPGQCAYADRALRSDEPDAIFLEIVYFGQIRQQLNGGTVDTSPTAAERDPDAQNLPKYLGDPNHYWSFFVHQNAPLPNGRFDASGGRYWKPALTRNELIVPVGSKTGNNGNPWVITPKKP